MYVVLGSKYEAVNWYVLEVALVPLNLITYPVMSLFLSIHLTVFQSIVIDVKLDVAFLKDSGTPLGAKLKDSLKRASTLITSLNNTYLQEMLLHSFLLKNSVRFDYRL